MKVLICGSREWLDPVPIKEVIDALSPGSTVIVGGARGADLIAQNLAEERDDITVKVFYAEWDMWGKRAGPMRNIEMLNNKPDIVYAFPLRKSKGTYHTINEAKKRNICTIIYGESIESNE